MSVQSDEKEKRKKHELKAHFIQCNSFISFEMMIDLLYSCVFALGALNKTCTPDITWDKNLYYCINLVTFYIHNFILFFFNGILYI